MSSSEIYFVVAVQISLPIRMRESHAVKDPLSVVVASTSSAAADPPPIAALSKAVVRTVTTLIVSFGDDLTFRIALPA